MDDSIRTALRGQPSIHERFCGNCAYHDGSRCRRFPPVFCTIPQQSILDPGGDTRVWKAAWLYPDREPGSEGCGEFKEKTGTVESFGL